MDRVQIGIIAVAIVLIVVAMLNAPPPAEPEPAPATQTEAASSPERPPAIDPPGAPSAAAPEAAAADPDPAAVRQGRVIELANDAISVRVNSLGGRVLGLQIPAYADRIGPGAQPVELVTTRERGGMVAFLGDGPLAGLENEPHEVVSSSDRHVELRVTRGGIELTRRLEIDPQGYGGRLRLSLKNRGSDTLSPRFQVVFYGEERPSDAPDRFQNYSLVALADGDVERMPLAGIHAPGMLDGLFGGGGGLGATYPAPVDWVGVDSQYFMMAAVAESPRESAAFLGPVGRDRGQAVLSYPVFQVPPGTGVERTYRLYLGPKVETAVQAVSPVLDPATVVGWAWVRPLVHLFATMLKWTYDNIVGNYGVAIILLTILLRLVTFPLTQRSMKSMKRFSLIAPQMKEIQEKYADDRTKMQEELMKLYRQKGMNPLAAMGGGCIPMLIQMPFMIALYFALQSSIDLRHAPFMFWINDLSAPENLFSIAGLPVRILPLLMGASMLLQQRMTPTPNADPQQRQMMQWMSVMFIFLFYQFPSGLVLYWFVSNLLGIAQQLLVNRSPAPEPAKA